jgi:hypothetical protein
MATPVTPTLSNLATESTYKVYICDKDGAKGSSNGIIANLDNTPNIRRVLLEHAITNRPLVYESTTYGFNDKNISAAASHYKYFLADGNATEGTVPAVALDITPYITNGFKTALYPDANDISASAGVDNISSGTYTYERRGNLQVLRIDTEGEAAVDSLYRIAESNGQIADRDILIVVGKDINRVISMYDHTVTATDTLTQNICLENATSFSTGESAKYGSTFYDKSSITLMWDANINLWIEVNRSPKSVITVQKLRDADINIPIKGTKVTTIAGTDVITTTAGVDPGILYFTGTRNLGSANYVVNRPTGTGLEGDTYTAVWDADITTTGNVSIFNTILTSTEAANGTTNPIEVKTKYVNGAWSNGIIISDSGNAEPALGNPSTDGMVLTSTAAGVRSWGASTGVKYKKFTFDTTTHGTAVATWSMSGDYLPAGALIDASQSFIVTDIALTSVGATDIKIGLLCSSTSGGHLATDDDFFLSAQDFDAAPLNAVGDVVMGRALFGKILGTATLTLDIVTHVLATGKISVYVAYIEGA